MKLTSLPGLAAMIAIIGTAAANPFPSASTDLERRTFTNTTWSGVVEGHAFELQGHATVSFPLNIFELLTEITQEVIAQFEALYPGVRERVMAQPTPRTLEPRNKAQLLCIPVTGNEPPLRIVLSSNSHFS